MMDRTRKPGRPTDLPARSPSRREVLLGIGASAALLRANAAPSAPPVANTRYGKVSGFQRNGASVFLGIPYGAPTGGDRRFLPPQPPAAWQGVREAVRSVPI